MQNSLQTLTFEDLMYKKNVALSSLSYYYAKKNTCFICVIPDQ